MISENPPCPPPPPLAETLEREIPRLMQKWKVPGVSLAWIKQRQIAGLRQYGVGDAIAQWPVKADSLFEACSMTKPLFAYAALKLVEEGELDLHRPLVHYLPGPYIADEEQHRKITAWMVLTHSSGLPNWRPGGRTGGEPLVVHFEPGTKTLYSGEGFWFLQRAIECITGASLEKWMTEKLLHPLGMNSSSLVWEPSREQRAVSGHTESGELRPDRSLFREANAAFSLYTTPEDYAQFLLEMMNPDRSTTHSLGAPLLKTMLTRHRELEETPSLQRCGPRKSELAFTGLGWRIDETADGDRFYHSGSNQTGFRCYAEFAPQAGEGFVIMTNADGGAALWREVIAGS